ncbi:hypothetical protein [Bradyrhizobium genosp. SA-3]|uniref:hypothetical protein n=1 Tax=Bradyrhizobium genosp. SA-3 TaxID=508868 RepID=UPI001FDFCEF8|nr:hypothetical protein [Bradyrhizobium genosp. SA-3]
MQAAASVRDDEIKRPDRDKAGDEKRHGPACLDRIQPVQERPAPSRRRTIGPFGHRLECKIERHGNQMKEGKAMREDDTSISGQKQIAMIENWNG